MDKKRILYRDTNIVCSKLTEKSRFDSVEFHAVRYRIGVKYIKHWVGVGEGVVFVNSFHVQVWHQWTSDCTFHTPHNFDLNASVRYIRGPKLFRLLPIDFTYKTHIALPRTGFWWCDTAPKPRQVSMGGLPYEKVGNARREFVFWPLRGTKKGVV